MQTTQSIETIRPLKSSTPGWKQKLMQWLRLSNAITVKLYHGYGYEQKLFIHGHVLALSPMPRKKYRNKLLVNLFSLIRLFIVKPVKHAHVQLSWEQKLLTAETDTDGFFRLEWTSDTHKKFGWHEILVSLVNAKGETVTTSNGFIFIPYATQYGFISDIDDTFLISHSSTIFKRLRVLFTNNARSRKPFEGVVEHYKLLAEAQTKPDEPNPFFYVSSSEWNLYDYIVEFTRVNELPRGVFLLNQMKQFSGLFKTGKSNHSGKFTRIVRILETFPKQKFILLGDSSQQDPYIYTSLVEHFPGRISAVYIRDIYKKNQQKVREALMKLDSTGVPYCFFAHSTDAIAHSRKIGLIK
jgi:phosphatidate phosphatase APP1